MMHRFPISSVAALLWVSSLAAPVRGETIAPDRRTTWNPGIPGGIPVRTTVCATLEASAYGNGLADATPGIQAAIDACPEGQVVRLSAGRFLVNGEFPITINRGIVLRGAGPSATRLVKTSLDANPLLVVGQRYLGESVSVALTTDAPRGATSVQVASVAGLQAGQLVLLDEVTDDSYVYWGTNPVAQPGGEARGWFTRYDRPVGQMVEIAAVGENTVSFTTPLHLGLDTAHAAQLTWYDTPYGARYAGVEDLYLEGGLDDNVTVRFAMYSWLKNVESAWSTGDSVALDFCFRCAVHDSYIHDTPFPFPGGAGYLLSVGEYSSDSLVENSIFVNANKVMVMRASGGGNVIAYNYFDNGFDGNSLEWVETGLNASHMTCPHYELFEGNQAFNIDGDDTWGGAVYNTFFRNHATGRRRSFSDVGNRRAIGLMYGHYYYNFVGNVLGTADQDPAPYTSFAYEDVWPWKSDPIGLWRIGYTPTDWNAPPDPRVVETTYRHGNFDYATQSVVWDANNPDQQLPDSLYLAGRPAFFGALAWPWVQPTAEVKLHTLPARARYDTGRPLAAPAITVPGDATVEATGPTGAAFHFEATAIDDVDGAVNVSCLPASGSTFPLGVTTVLCSATDARQNTDARSFTVTVRDTTAPVITAPGDTILEAAGSAGTAFAFAASATDAVDGAVTTACLPASGTTFPLGATLVTCSASDAQGNVGSVAFTVTVRDTTPPLVTVPAPAAFEATSPLGVTFTYASTATDVVDGIRPVLCVPPSGFRFPLGVTTVTCTAVDIRGNVGMATFTVTVGGATLISWDGFESGTLGSWSGSVTGGGDLGVSSAAALAGSTFGLEARVNDRAALYVQDDGPQDERRYRARFYFDPNGFAAGARFRTRIFAAFAANPNRRLATIVLSRRAGTLGLNAQVRLDGVRSVTTPVVPLTDAPHAVELDWKASASAGAHDGSLQLWVDGILVATLSGLDNDQAGVDFVRLGVLSVSRGARGTLYFDEFASGREGYIGP